MLGELSILRLGALILILEACAQAPEVGVVNECILPQEQAGTVFARWPVLPVPLQWDSDFSTTERATMVSAVNSWNGFYDQSQGYPLFLHGGGATTDVNITDVSSVGSILNGNRFEGKVTLFKRSSQWRYDQDAIAVTTFAKHTDPTGYPLQVITNGMIELNYIHYFAPGKQSQDLESIVLHELGHLVGLDHSCEVSSERSGMPDCVGFESDHPYLQASLFPVFQSGEQRRSLGLNDMGRANCLYID